MRKIVMIGLLIFFMIFLSGTVSAANYIVTPGTNSIQNAVNIASDGDTLNLTTGTYNESNIKVNKSLIIAGPETTGTSSPTAIIDAKNQGRVFNITCGVNVTLKYLTVINGNASKDTANQNGGGIYSNGSNVAVIGCNISNNTAVYGGGIYNYQGICTVSGSIINSNTASYTGGGIYNQGTCTVSGSNINGNTATNYGGGIYNTGTCTVSGSNINNNNASYAGGGICNTGTCTVSGSNINGNTASSRGGGIYNYGTCTVSGSNINGNNASVGGAIFNEGTCTVTGSNINGNTATSYGGGIYNQGTCTVSGSNINGNTATNYYGGGIYSYGTCTVTGSNINGNTASSRGGGIYNSGPLAVTGCNFELNASPAGNAIFNGGGDTSNRVIHFNRFYNPGTGYEVYCSSGSMDDRYNWWGSNLNPSSKVFGNVTVSPWIVLNVKATPCLIGKNVNSIVTADLAHDSNGVYHDPADVHVPNSIPVQFFTTLGSIASQSSLLNVFASATLTGGTISGTANVFVFLDDAITQTSVIIETLPPTASANVHSGLYNTVLNVVLSANEPASIYYTTDGSIPTTSSHKYTAPIFISSNTTLKFFAVDTAGNPSNVYTETYNIDTTAPTVSANPKGGLYNANKYVYLGMNEPGTIYYTTNGVNPTTSSTPYTGAILVSYTTTLKFFAVDTAGNPSTVYTETYTIDKVAPKVVSTSPRNYATGVSRTSTIAIKFSKNIKASTYWSKIYIKNLKTGKLVSISKKIVGNTLYLRTTTARTAYASYQVYIPGSAVKDYAGNNLASRYTFRFKTGR